ncbi:MAG: DUF2058 domain-containing protein [Woeseiaceae bacterium]
MGNPFQDQFLKAGMVTKQQVKKAQSSSSKKKKEQRSKKTPVVDENKLKLQQAAKEKIDHDKALNLRKQEQAKQKATSVEIDQLITNNLIKRNEQECDIVYNFEHRKKVNHIYIDVEMKNKVINGAFGIARIDGRYELVPKLVAEKIQQRNEKRVILFEIKDSVVDENDPYAEFQVPDDLMW